MLNEGKITVGKIAEKLGYSSPFAFSLRKCTEYLLKTAKELTYNNLEKVLP